MSESRITASIRRLVLHRAAETCEYCRSQARYIGPLTMDHIQPRSHGGTAASDNLAAACAHCNQFKHDLTHAIDPITGASVSLFNPRKQQWSEHFHWDNEAIRIIGLTAIGRATVDVLQLNRDNLCNLRQLLVAVGEHPPL